MKKAILGTLLAFLGLADAARSAAPFRDWITSQHDGAGRWCAAGIYFEIDEMLKRMELESRFE